MSIILDDDEEYYVRMCENQTPTEEEAQSFDDLSPSDRNTVVDRIEANYGKRNALRRLVEFTFVHKDALSFSDTSLYHQVAATGGF